MKRAFSLIMILAVIGGLGIGASACGSGSRTAAPDETTLQSQADTLIEGLQDIGLELGGDSFGDLGIPVAELDMPDFEAGSFDLNLGVDTTANFTFNLPDLSSFLPSLDTGLIPEIPEGLALDDSLCEMFKLVPDCSYVPEEVRDLCEQCKENQ